MLVFNCPNHSSLIYNVDSLVNFYRPSQPFHRVFSAVFKRILYTDNKNFTKEDTFICPNDRVFPTVAMH